MQRTGSESCNTIALASLAHRADPPVKVSHYTLPGPYAQKASASRAKGGAGGRWEWVVSGLSMRGRSKPPRFALSLATPAARGFTRYRRLLPLQDTGITLTIFDGRDRLSIDEHAHGGRRECASARTGEMSGVGREAGVGASIRRWPWTRRQRENTEGVTMRGAFFAHHVVRASESYTPSDDCIDASASRWVNSQTSPSATRHSRAAVIHFDSRTQELGSTTTAPHRASQSSRWLRCSSDTVRRASSRSNSSHRAAAYHCRRFPPTHATRNLGATSRFREHGPSSRCCASVFSISIVELEERSCVRGGR